MESQLAKRKVKVIKRRWIAQTQEALYDKPELRMLVQAATKRPGVHHERLQSISQHNWRQLETAFASLSNRKLGLYPLDGQPEAGTLDGFETGFETKAD